MKIEKENQELEAQGGLLSLAGAGEGNQAEKSVTGEAESMMVKAASTDELLQGAGLTEEPELEEEKNKGGKSKKEPSEYERRKAEIEARRGLPDREYLDWDRDIWELDLPEKETMALVKFRAQAMGLPVEGAIKKTEPKMLEKVAVQIGKGQIEDPGDLVTKISHKEMAIEDRRVLVDLLQMKGPKEKPLAQVAMRLFSYLPMVESADLKCYKEALEEIMEDYLDDEPEKGQRKKRMTVKELCQGAMREVWREKQIRQQERLWLGEDED